MKPLFVDKLRRPVRNPVLAMLCGVWLLGGCGTIDDLNETAAGLNGDTSDVVDQDITPPGPALTASPVGFRMVLEQAPAAGGLAPAAAGDAALLVTQAVVNLRDIELEAPGDWDCARYGDETDEDDDADEDGDDADADDDGDDADDDEDEDTDDADEETDRDDDEDEKLGAAAATDAAAPATRVASCEATGGETVLKFAGPFRVDLLSGESSPSLADLAIPPGTYTRIDLRIDDLDPEDDDVAPDDLLQEASLLAYAQYTTDVTHVVRMRLKFNEDIRFVSDAGFAIEATGGADLAVRIAAADWFAGVPDELDACLADDEDVADDGIIAIDEVADVENECNDVEDVLKENFKRSGQLDREDHEDHDDEGEDHGDEDEDEDHDRDDEQDD